MNDERGLPPYPPARNAWDYPPPPISRRWIWAPVVAVFTAVAAGIALIVGAVVIMNDDFPAMIEDDRIVSVIARECEIMTETVKSMPIKGSAAEQADVVTDQNKAITNMLTAIRKIDGDVLRADPPTNRWLADWETLIAAREAFAEQRRDGYDADLQVPRDPDGEYTYLRMDQVWVSKSVCTVPEELLNPYVEDVSAI